MFIKKEEYEKLKRENTRLNSENKVLKDRLERVQEEKNKKIQELREGYEENKKLHKKLVAIERLLNLTFGSYNELLKFRNNVQNIIKNELADANQTNSNR